MSIGLLEPSKAAACLLGALLLDPERILEVSEIVIAEDFSDSQHRAVWRAVHTLFEAGRPIDFVLVSEWLSRDPDARTCAPSSDWSDFLVDLADLVTSSAHAAHHAQVVAESAALRRLGVVVGNALDESRTIQPGIDDRVGEFFDRFETQIHRIGQRRLGGNEPVPIGDAMIEVLSQAQNPTEDRYVRTGIGPVDDLVDGLQPGRLTVVAARTSVGKSAFGLVVALNAARMGKRALFVTLEMLTSEVATRAAANLAGVDATCIFKGKLTEDEIAKVRQATEEYLHLGIRVWEAPGLTIPSLRGRIRRELRGGLDLVVVDYLQLIRAPEAARDRVQEVSVLSRGLKALAIELKVPVLTMSQLSRKADGERPRLSHLRESGTIEQDADAVILLRTEEDDRDDQLRAHVAKNRNGPTGEVELIFQRRFMRISGDEGAES